MPISAAKAAIDVRSFGIRGYNFFGFFGKLVWLLLTAIDLIDIIIVLTGRNQWSLKYDVEYSGFFAVACFRNISG